MRTIDRSSAFKRDYKRETRGRHRTTLVKPDLLSIYRKSDSDTLRLARLGSHSEIFG